MLFWSATGAAAWALNSECTMRSRGLKNRPCSKQYLQQKSRLCKNAYVVALSPPLSPNRQSHIVNASTQDLHPHTHRQVPDRGTSELLVVNMQLSYKASTRTAAAASIRYGVRLRGACSEICEGVSRGQKQGGSGNMQEPSHPPCRHPLPGLCLGRTICSLNRSCMPVVAAGPPA